MSSFGIINHSVQSSEMSIFQLGDDVELVVRTESYWMRILWVPL